MQVACFQVGEGEYALDIMRIKEIINVQRVTPVPRSPAFVEGLIELRGAFIPIVDLRKRFSVTPAAIRAEKCIVVGMHGPVIGLIVDRVTEVARVAQDELTTPPVLSQRRDAALFAACIKRNDRILLVVDLDALLSQAEAEDLRVLTAEDVA